MQRLIDGIGNKLCLVNSPRTRKTKAMCSFSHVDPRIDSFPPPMFNWNASGSQVMETGYCQGIY